MVWKADDRVASISGLASKPPGNKTIILAVKVRKNGVLGYLSSVQVDYLAFLDHAQSNGIDKS